MIITLKQQIDLLYLVSQLPLEVQKLIWVYKWAQESRKMRRYTQFYQELEHKLYQKPKHAFHNVL